MRKRSELYFEPLLICASIRQWNTKQLPTIKIITWLRVGVAFYVVLCPNLMYLRLNFYGFMFPVLILLCSGTVLRVSYSLVKLSYCFCHLRRRRCTWNWRRSSSRKVSLFLLLQRDVEVHPGPAMQVFMRSLFPSVCQIPMQLSVATSVINESMFHMSQMCPWIFSYNDLSAIGMSWYSIIHVICHGELCHDLLYVTT